MDSLDPVGRLVESAQFSFINRGGWALGDGLGSTLMVATQSCRSVAGMAIIEARSKTV
jgi:hypothetical protein